MLRSSTILHVEDDQNDVLLFQLAFARVHLPHVLRHAGDGREALDYLKGVGRYADRSQYPVPQLMLLDLKLPGLSGFEVLAWTRAQAEWRELAVFILTSSNQDRDIAEARALGADEYFVKTTDFRDVVSAVCCWSASATGGSQAAKSHCVC